MGAKLVKEVASKTSDNAGDGTTTATVMAEAIFNEGLKAVVAGVNPVQMKQGIEKAVEDITAELKKMSIKVKSTLPLRRETRLHPRFLHPMQGPLRLRYQARFRAPRRA